MKVNISFKIVDSDFDQKYADKFYNGNESDGNYKYHSIDAYAVEEVTDVLVRTGSLTVPFRLKNGEKVSCLFYDMEIFDCITEKTVTSFAVSKKILKSIHTVSRGEIKDVAFYISDQFEVIRITPIVYIDASEFPPILADKISMLMK